MRGNGNEDAEDFNPQDELKELIIENYTLTKAGYLALPTAEAK